MNIPKFNTQKELFNFLIENEKDLTSFKKHTLKTADAFSYSESSLRPNLELLHLFRLYER